MNLNQHYLHRYMVFICRNHLVQVLSSSATELSYDWNFVKEENERLGRGTIGEEVMAKVMAKAMAKNNRFVRAQLPRNDPERQDGADRWSHHRGPRSRVFKQHSVPRAGRGAHKTNQHWGRKPLHRAAERRQGKSQQLTDRHHRILGCPSLSAPRYPSGTACHFVNIPTTEQPLPQGW